MISITHSLFYYAGNLRGLGVCGVWRTRPVVDSVVVCKAQDVDVFTRFVFHGYPLTRLFYFLLSLSLRTLVEFPTL